MSEQRSYQQAKKRVREKLGFYSHFAVFIVVISLLAVINYTTTPDQLWFVWVLLGWGAGVLAHGVGVFFLAGKVSSLEQKMIAKELKKSK